MDCFDPPAFGRVLSAVAVALPAGIATAAGLYALLEQMRDGNWLLRFLARAWIVGGAYTAFGFTAVLVGGPCVVAGPMRFGGYNKDPMTGTDILTVGLVVGLVGAVLWPLLAKAQGQEADL